MNGIIYVIIYYAICASLAVIIRWKGRLPNEVFRKLLHFILLGSLGLWLDVFPTWQSAAATAIAFEIVVYPILCILERLDGYSQFVTERSKGELKQSLILVFTMFAVVIFICWGITGQKYLTLASVYAWGFGDAAAALAGKRFGKHKIPKIAQGKKSMEGSLAMLFVSFISVLCVFALFMGPVDQRTIWLCLITAVFTTLAELVSGGGMDTVICPLVAMCVLLIGNM